MRPRLKAILLTGLVLLACLLGGCASEKTAEEELKAAEEKVNKIVKENGMLEDFATFLIPKDDSLLPEVDKVLTDIETRKLNRYNPTHHSKARIHTWLAWQKDPGTPLGWAVTKKYLSATPPICQDFVNWLNALYNAEIESASVSGPLQTVLSPSS